MTDFLIHDGSTDYADVTVNGEPKGRGYVPRDYHTYPQEMFAPPSELVLIPQSEWAERIRDMEATKSRLSDIRDRGDKGSPIKSLDQNGQGYCWAYSSTSAVMLTRAANNQPYVRLSAHAVACMIKNYRDEGGWCGLSAKFYRERGCPSVEFWPEKSMSRANDTPETWANAAQHKITEDFVDLTREVYDQNLTFAQAITCLLSRIPCPMDFNHWSHSVCGCDPVNGTSKRGTYRVESGKLASLEEFDLHWGMNDPVTGGFAVRIWNSWTNDWGVNGMGVLTGQKAIPNGALAVRSVPVSNV